MAVEKCPSCSTSLRLFTPRDALRHINACLDTAAKLVQDEAPPCAVCNRDLTSLTSAARQEHVNRCLDQTDPAPAAPPRRPVLVPQLPELPADKALTDFLAALGLSRYVQRFAKEEIDLDALRLLSDEELVALKLPDAARRRIADALTNVDLLRTIAGEQLTQVENSTPMATQKLPPSRVNGAKLMVVDEDSDDDEFLGLYDDAHSPPPLAPTTYYPDDGFDIIHDEPPSPPLPFPIVDSSVTNDPGEKAQLSPVKNRNVLNGDSSENSKKVEQNSKMVGKLTQHDELPNNDGMESGRKYEGRPRVRFAPNDDSAVEPCTKRSPNTWTLCSVEPAPSSGMDELEVWRNEAINKETQRHKRKLEEINQQYRRLRQKIDNSAPIDLTLDESPEPSPKTSSSASAPNGRATVLAPVMSFSPHTKVVEKRSKTWTSGITPVAKRERKSESPSHGTEPMGLERSWKSDLVDDESDEEYSRNRQSIIVTATSPAPKPSPLSRVNDDSDEDGDDDLLEMSFSQRVAAKCNRTQREVVSTMGIVEEENSRGGTRARNEKSANLDDCEDDEVMDLTQKPYNEVIEPNPLQQLVDMRSRESVECMSSAQQSQGKRKGSRLKLQPKPASTVENEDDDNDDVMDLTQKVDNEDVNSNATSAQVATQAKRKESRLKKPAKCTPTEIRAAIRADEKLYDDILRARMVDMERFVAVTKAASLNLSTAKLEQFLVDEGLSVRGKAGTSGKGSQFFKGLCIAEMQN